MRSYPHFPGAKTGGPSQAAANRIAPIAGNLRGRALDVISSAAGPLTADEIAATLNVSVLSARPRIAELHRLGMIEPGPDRRKNASGMSASTWQPSSRSAS